MRNFSSSEGINKINEVSEGRAERGLSVRRRMRFVFCGGVWVAGGVVIQGWEQIEVGVDVLLGGEKRRQQSAIPFPL